MARKINLMDSLLKIHSDYVKSHNSISGYDEEVFEMFKILTGRGNLEKRDSLARQYLLEECKDANDKDKRATLNRMYNLFNNHKFEMSKRKTSKVAVKEEIIIPDMEIPETELPREMVSVRRIGSLENNCNFFLAEKSVDFSNKFSVKIKNAVSYLCNFGKFMIRDYKTVFDYRIGIKQEDESVKEWRNYLNSSASRDLLYRFTGISGAGKVFSTLRSSAKQIGLL